MKHRIELLANRRAGLTIPELMVFLVILAFLSLTALFILQHKYSRAGGRFKVSRVRSDHRSLATAIETYYIDHNEYPAATRNWRQTWDADAVRGNPPKHFGFTFMARNNTGLETLTTPIAYITSNFPDPFADSRGVGFRYYCDGRGWILGSYGPDEDMKTGGQLYWDLGVVADRDRDDVYTTPTLTAVTTSGIEAVYWSTIVQPSPDLLAGSGPRGAFTYNPTNGTLSPGDVWRVKQ